MATSDPRVDAYIAAAAPFARPILGHIRALVHASFPDAGETLEWGMPWFVVGGKNLCGMAAFEAHCAFVPWQGTSAAPEEAMGYLGRITTLADLPSDDELVTVLRGVHASGGPRTPTKPPPETPEDLSAALEAAPAAKTTFDALAPSHRREYVRWITEAKREETRKRRVAQAIEMLAEGRKAVR